LATPGSITGASQPIVSPPGAAASYVVTTSSSSPAAGRVVTITAQLRDANNNPVAQQGQSVAWSKSDPNGSFPGGATDVSTTNASGVAQVALTTHTVAGTSTTVTATTGALTGTTTAIITVAGPATTVAVAQAPSATPASRIAFAPQPVIQLQ